MRRMEERMPMRRNQDWGLATGRGGGSFWDMSPWQMMRRMQDDMDRMFDLFFGGQPGQAAAPAQAGQQLGSLWAPSIDVSESEREWCVEAELPGVSKDDIDVELRDHHLILNARMQEEREEQPEEGQRQYYWRERRYGSFQRAIPLPENVDEGQISCEFRNGVLTIHLPKSEQGRGARRVPVYDADQLPSETASGRTRSSSEMKMTGETAEAAPAGAKGGETGGAQTGGAKAGAKKTGTTRSTRSRKKES